MKEMEHTNEFNKIKNLKWYPWVGENYARLAPDHKIFILGESSRYGIGDTNNTIEKYEDKKYINNHIEEAISGAYKEYGSKLLTNMHKTLLGSDEIKPDKFWDNVVSTNFIQRALDYTYKERPSGKDYEEAWEVLFNLFELLKPKYCVFFGSSAIQTLEKYARVSDLKMDKISYDVQIGKYYGYSTQVLVNQNSITLIFIKHPSSYYSWKPWREYLLKKVPVLEELI
jgi:hypothetical protein